MILLFGILLFILVLVVAGGWITQNIAMANQAAATIEVAKVARASETNSTILAAVLAIIVVLFVVLAIGGAFLFFRFRLSQERDRSGKWVSGPNANFGKLPTGGSPIDVNTLIALAVLKQLNGNSSNNPGNYLPAEEKSFDEIVSGWDWYR